nr:hypothetical protein GCM10020241_12810 [Streptoalloteichus tenebrarius]
MVPVRRESTPSHTPSSGSPLAGSCSLAEAQARAGRAGEPPVLREQPVGLPRPVALAGDLVGEGRAVGREPERLDREPPGELVRAVLVERPGVHRDDGVRRGGADQPHQPFQRVGVLRRAVPDPLGERGGERVPEVRLVEVEDVADGGVRHGLALLALAEQSQPRALLLADGVAAALAPGDRRDAHAPAAPLVPLTERRQGLELVVGMRADEQHVVVRGVPVLGVLGLCLCLGLCLGRGGDQRAGQQPQHRDTGDERGPRRVASGPGGNVGTGGNIERGHGQALRQRSDHEPEESWRSRRAGGPNPSHQVTSPMR